VSFVRQHFSNENFDVATISIAGNWLYGFTPTTLEQNISGRNADAVGLIFTRAGDKRSQPRDAAAGMSPRERPNVGRYSFSRQ
jgi:hypothetical protein